VPGSEAHGRASVARALTGAPDARARVPDAPTSLAAYRARVTRTAVSLEDFRAFLASAETRGWVAAIVRERVPAGDVDDLAQDALAEALKAFVTAPPAKDEVLVAWIATIARRVVADSLKKRGRRRKYEGPMPDDPDPREPESSSADDEGEGVAEPSYDPREGSVDDRELQGRSLLQWLERQVANNPLDRETLEILLEHGLGQKTYQTLADGRGITLTVLSSRIFAFRNKYVARYNRERQRAWLLLLLFLFGGALVAVLVWLLSRHDEPPRGTVRPATPSIIDRAIGRPLPVGRSRPDDAPGPDAGAAAP
jgi:DNA-directed RNA polymerase specialized sigma24 family protein